MQRKSTDERAPAGVSLSGLSCILCVMEPDYEWLRGLERSNARELLEVLQELKRSQELTTPPMSVVISDAGPTEGNVWLPHDQMEALRQWRARLMASLKSYGIIEAFAAHVRRDRVIVRADEGIVRRAIEVLRGDQRPTPPVVPILVSPAPPTPSVVPVPVSSAPAPSTPVPPPVPAKGPLRRALGKVTDGALEHLGAWVMAIILTILGTSVGAIFWKPLWHWIASHLGH